ncbi:MAG: cell adhesion domain protein [Gemmatimonadetes bacterium]|nr:cell adhesion domain protein [Gemmatimonadota bacterium]
MSFPRSPLTSSLICSAVACALLLGCSSATDAGAASSSAPATSLRIIGASDAYLTEGTSRQLTAVGVDASGNTSTRGSVAWTTSDTTVAIISSSGLLQVVGSGTFTISASSASLSATLPSDARAEGMLTPGMYSIALSRKDVKLYPKAGVITAPVTVSVEHIPGFSSDARIAGGSIFRLDIGAASLPAAIIIACDNLRKPVDAGGNVRPMVIARYDSGRWISLRESSGADGSANCPLYASDTLRSGIYAVIARTTDRVVLGGEWTRGDLTPGMSAHVTAQPVDALGFGVEQTITEWASSDPGVVSVDQHGTMTGLRVGTSVISATVEGVSDTMSVSVLPKPLVAWNQSADWITSAGSLQRTAFVNAVVDPAAIRLRWTSAATIPPGNYLPARINQAVTGNGMVYASQQVLEALDPISGQVRWQRPWGPSYSTPVFDDGRIDVVSGIDPFGFDATTGAQLYHDGFYGGGGTNKIAALDGRVFYMGRYPNGITGYEVAPALGGHPPKFWFAPITDQTPGVPAYANGELYAFGQSVSYGPSQFHVYDPATGAELRQLTDATFPVAAEPVVTSSGQVITVAPGRIISVDPTVPKVNWNVQLAGTPTEGVGAEIAVGDGHVYLVHDRGVESHRESDGSLEWRFQVKDFDITGSVIATRNLVFFSAHPVGAAYDVRQTYAIDVTTHRLIWSWPAYGALSVGADGSLYLMQADGALLCFSMR